MNVLTVQWSVNDEYWYVGDAAQVGEVLVVSGESAFDDFVLQDLQ